MAEECRPSGLCGNGPAGGRSSSVSRLASLWPQLFKIVIPFDSLISLLAGYSKRKILSTEKAVRC